MEWSEFMNFMDCTCNIHIACEHCGTEYNHLAHNIVQKTESPGLAQKIVDDEFFDAVCPNCHRTTRIDHPVVYVDAANHALFAYIDSDIEFALAQAQMVEWMREFGVDNKNSTVRIVSMQNELREKVLLLKNSLDDRVIEILKLWALDRVRDEGHMQEFEEIRCALLEDGDLNVDFVGPEPRHLRISRSYYDRVAKELIPAFNKLPTPLEVSTAWAIDFDLKNRL
jgi:hypothetical protein